MQNTETLESDIQKYLIPIWQKNWNRFARDILNVNLDPEMEKVLHSAQVNRRTSVRSGNSRGKDFVSAVASVCFLILNYPSKVINTAPTGRQVQAIMLPEIKNLYARASKIMPLGGRVLNDRILFDDPRHYLLGFKAGDKATESWSGFHSPNVMVVVTEASGIDDITYNAIEGILQGNSRLLLAFNPNIMSGEAYKSASSKQYAKFRLNCMDAPNVTNFKKVIDGEITKDEYNKLHIPGQVDYEWINEKIEKPGWVTMIPKEESKGLDFEWNGKYYRPNDLFRIKVLGEFGTESENVLIPLQWLEAAYDRHDAIMQKGFKASEPLRLGVDVAGMGRDNTIFAHRYGMVVTQFKTLPVMEKTPAVHMKIAGQIVEYLRNSSTFAFIDTIGEGAGVYSRLYEQEYYNAISAKASFGARGLTDETGVRKFANMRAYMYWMIRDALNPVFENNLAIPRDDMLTEELTETGYTINSKGEILIEKKDDIIERLGRSPDKADGLALTFFPEKWQYRSKTNKSASKSTFGFH